MKREVEAELLEFCRAQRAHFAAEMWAPHAGLTAETLAVAARFLAGVTWYGHEAELEQIAARLTDLSFPELIVRAELQPSRFSSLLKAHLRHFGHRVAA